MLKTHIFYQSLWDLALVYIMINMEVVTIDSSL